ncbi:MAG TPA: hypothetical protein EYN92_05195, partial [Dehalococcoidia bacterium]|nr:hypothetical protein [Dehalococcoidia bacterium]
MSLGTSPGDSNTVNWTDVGNVSTYTFTNLNLIETVTYYASVQAQDMAGNMSDIYTGDGITIDQSGPEPGQVNDGSSQDIDWVNIDYSVDANWTVFTDTLSGVVEYWISIGLTPGQPNFMPWISNGLDTTFTAAQELSEGPTYYINIYAIDSVGNTSAIISSDGFGVDLDSPLAGTVFD